MDILDEKFVVTAFIAGLGVQSKDLMFSILKNAQASMAEVLAKTEKYINSEEALLSNQRSSSCHAPNPGPTRSADSNRFPGRETQDWDSLPVFFF